MEEYNNKGKKKLNNFITKVLLSIILCFCSLIYIKKDEKNLENFNKYIFSDTFSFSKANKLLSKYLDKKLLSSVNNKETAMAFNENLEITKEKFENGMKLKYPNLTAVKSIESGIVVYMGEKENLGNTIIIQGVDGYDIWYSNINNTSIKIYDYVEKDGVLGDTEELIITISKDGKFIEYEKYIKEV